MTRVLYQGPLVAVIDEQGKQIDVRINHSVVPDYPGPDYLDPHIDRLVDDLKPYLDKGYMLNKDFERGEK